MDKVLKAFLNTLKCPICGGLIDIFDGSNFGIHRRMNYACAQDHTHYALSITNDPYPFIGEEYVDVLDGKHKYHIQQYHYFHLGQRTSNTRIIIFDLDGDNNPLPNPRKEDFYFKKSIFDFSKTNKYKLLNKVKTILVFQ